MSTIKTAARVLACALALGALAGCRQTEGQSTQDAPAVEAARTSTHSFSFGAGEVKATTLVKRRVAPNGAEALESSTEIWLGGPHPLIVAETAEIGPTGRLQSATADLFSGPRASQLVRSVEIDAKAGNVTVRDERGVRTLVVSTDHPWMYGALFDDVSRAASSTTPIMAWVARRAAQAGAKVREVDVAAASSHLTIPEQLVFQDGPIDLVVLGDEVAEADRDFIRTLPWKPLATENDARVTSLACDQDEC